jgi:hypothetical protein
MDRVITEFNRFRQFRLFSVTEIIPPPYKGGIVSAVILVVGLELVWCHFLNQIGKPHNQFSIAEIPLKISPR